MSPFPVGPATLFPIFASFPPSRFSKWQALMGCPCLSSCLLRQMSAVSAVITAQLNINDSLAWQVLAGQRRGERGTPLDKTRNEKEKWWLYLLDRFSFVSLNLCICMCAISRFLAWHDGFIALFFFPSEEMNLFVFPLPLILPTGIADMPFKHLCVCVSVYVHIYIYTHRLVVSVPVVVSRAVFVSFISSCAFLKRASWTLMLAPVIVMTAGHSENSEGQ